jgi:hypothetical protein
LKFLRARTALASDQNVDPGALTRWKGCALLRLFGARANLVGGRVFSRV